MLKDFLKGNIKIVESVDNWQKAIKLASQSLIDNGNIKPQYVDAIIETTNKNGPYYILTDGMAMPHARPENGVIKTGISFLKVTNGVKFDNVEKKVYLLFTLAAEDANGHQDAIAQLADFLDDEEKMKKLIEENLTEEEILNLF